MSTECAHITAHFLRPTTRLPQSSQLRPGACIAAVGARDQAINMHLIAMTVAESHQFLLHLQFSMSHPPDFRQQTRTESGFAEPTYIELKMLSIFIYWASYLPGAEKYIGRSPFTFRFCNLIGQLPIFLLPVHRLVEGTCVFATFISFFLLLLQIMTMVMSLQQYVVTGHAIMT